MILLVDIGNTNTTIGCYYNNKIRNVLRLKTIIDGRDSNEYSYILDGFIKNEHVEKPEGAAICSVVPEVTPYIAGALEKAFDIKPIDVNCNVKTALKFMIKDSNELGADRIANAVAASKLYTGNVIIADFGTATTFCVVTEKGEYSGGAIMPGIGLAALSLAEKTARLPMIELKSPDTVLGKNTEENICSGIIVGHAGAVERVINDIKAETGRDYKVLVTGGLADLLTPHIKSVHYRVPLLTLEGLRFIYEMNE